MEAAVRSSDLLASLQRSEFMPPEDVSEDRELSYPCECGGNITKDPKQGNQWQCDNCDWMPAPTDCD